MTLHASIAMIVTSQTSMDSGEPTGAWFEEIATPYYTFTDAGASVGIASIKGEAIPSDPRSYLERGHNSPSAEWFLDDSAAMRELAQSLPPGSLLVDDYGAFVLAGGHGMMWKFPDNITLTGPLSQAWVKGKVVSARLSRSGRNLGHQGE